eukprot:6671667-Pyramimonas_sp.AAC.2
MMVAFVVGCVAHHYMMKMKTWITSMGESTVPLEAVGGARKQRLKTKQSKRTVSTQSMTTYARHKTQPRFVLTPASCEGCWSYDERLDDKVK